MRVVVQRVQSASVRVLGQIVGEIGPGLLVLLGISHSDNQRDVDYMVDKLVGLRIFEDDTGKMNRSLQDIGGSLLIVSQFTLYGDCRKGRRPSFGQAAAPDLAKSLYDLFLARLRHRGVPVASGIFQADMQVSLVNDGPVTLIVDSPAPEREAASSTSESGDN